MPPAEQAAARRAAGAVDTDRKAKALSVEFLLQTHQVDETLETKAAWQTSFDCRLDDLRREESDRQGHPNRTHSLALPRSERLQSQAGIGKKFVQPAMRAAKGFDQDRARVGGHRAGIGLPIGCALEDLAL